MKRTLLTLFDDGQSAQGAAKEPRDVDSGREEVRLLDAGDLAHLAAFGVSEGNRERCAHRLRRNASSVALATDANKADEARETLDRAGMAEILAGRATTS